MRLLVSGKILDIERGIQTNKLSTLEKSSSGSTVHREVVIGTPRTRELERTLNL